MSQSRSNGRMSPRLLTLSSFVGRSRSFSRNIQYVQGQSPEEKIREYFYYVDHQGQLFLDDARVKNFTSCFKEKQFLQFFFTRIERNRTARYQETFPFVSLCGRERNFVRCDDLPIVFTDILLSKSETEVDQLSYACAGSLLTFPFSPQDICMLPLTGRVYHTGPKKAGGVGLIKSSLAIEMSKNFEFNNGEKFPPTHFTWKNRRHVLTNALIEILQALRKETRVHNSEDI